MIKRDLARSKRTSILVPAGVLVCALLCAGAANAKPATADPATTNPAPADAANTSAPGPYVPGVGEIMGATQMRHIKLWYAGFKKNWPLARYELGEIKEGLATAVAYHPVFKGAPVAAMYERFTRQPFLDVEQAIDKQDNAAFASAYKRLTAACNDCHRASDKAFIVITVPNANPYSDQWFPQTWEAMLKRE